MASPTVVLLGTLETKGREYGYVHDHLSAQGMRTILVDAGVLGEPPIPPDFDRHEVARAAGTDVAARRWSARRYAARGPVTLFVPMRGVSLIAVEGGVFHDPEADAALVDALREHLDPRIDVRYVETDINDPAFAQAMAD